jgi:hypothetical protein
MTLTSCYTMSTASSAPITMTEPTKSITEITSSIYEASTVTFVNDLDAYATVDIN